MRGNDEPDERRKYCIRRRANKRAQGQKTTPHRNAQRSLKTQVLTRLSRLSNVANLHLYLAVLMRGEVANEGSNELVHVSVGHIILPRTRQNSKKGTRVITPPLVTGFDPR